MLFKKQAVHDAWAATDRILDFKIVIKDKTYTAADITSLTFDSGAMNGAALTVGSTYQNTIKITFSHLIENLELLDEVTPQIGIRLPDNTWDFTNLGVFVLDSEVVQDRNNNTTTLSASDRMCMLGGTYESKLTYPAPISDIAIEVANLAGVKVNETDFARIPNTEINSFGSVTYRDAIGYVAQFAGGFATFDRDGLLDVRTLSDPNFVISPAQYQSKGLNKNESFYRIGGITCTVTTITKDESGNEIQETKTLQAGSSSGTQIALINPSMTQVLLDGLYQQLQDINFYPFSLSWFGDPSLEVGDWITVKDTAGNEFKTPNLLYSLTFGGGLSAVSKADTTVASSASFVYKGQLSQDVENIRQHMNASGNIVSEGIDPPSNPKPGDIWFVKDGPDTIIKTWVIDPETGIGSWQEQVSTKPDEKLQESIDNAAKDAADALDKSNSAVDNANKAVSDAGFANQTANDAKSSAADAIGQANEAKNNADNALKNSSDALADAANAINTANNSDAKASQAQKDANAATGKAEDAISTANKAQGDATSALGNSNTAISNARDALNKYNNLDIGGRNYLLNSGNFNGTTPWGFNDGTTISIKDNAMDVYKATPSSYSGIEQVIDLTPDMIGETFIISTIAKRESDSDIQNIHPLIHWLAANGSTIISQNSYFNDKCVLANEYSALWWTGTIPADTTAVKMRIVFLRTGTNTTAYHVLHKNFKFEFGNKATDWSPAPEDVQIQITNINGELSQKASQTDYNSLKGTVQQQGTSITQNSNAIKLKADQTTVDTINQTVKSQGTEIAQNSHDIQLKADSSTVDTLSGKVSENSAAIKLNADGIALKADKSTVDTINKTVNSNTAAIGVNADAIKLKANQSTVDSLSGRVSTAEGKIEVQAGQIAQTVSKTELTNTLGSYATQTWTQGQIKTTADNINLSVSKVQSTIDGMELGGRNYLKNSDQTVVINGDTDHYKIFYNQLAVDNWTFSANVKYTKGSLTKVAVMVYDAGHKNQIMTTVCKIVDGKITATFQITNASAKELLVYASDTNYAGTTGNILEVDHYKLEKGNKLSDWTPAPEDAASATDFANLEIKVNGIQGTVANKADKSQVTQLADQLTSSVTDLNNDISSQFTQLSSMIDLRVKADGVVNSINVSKEGILIAGQKVHITGQTTIDNAVIKDAMIATLSASKLTAGTIDAANINVINLNASNITTGTITGTNLSINLNTGEILFTKGSIKSTDGLFSVDVTNKLISSFNKDVGNGLKIDSGSINYYAKQSDTTPGATLQMGYQGTNLTEPYVFLNSAKRIYISGNTSQKSIAGQSISMATNSIGVISGPDLTNQDNYSAINFTVWDKKQTNMGSVNMYSDPEGILSAGDTTFKTRMYASADQVQVMSKNTTIYGDSSDFIVASDGKPFVRSLSTYVRTYSSGDHMCITGYGTFGRITSASKYKLDISNISNLSDQAHSFLSISPKQWFDKTETEGVAKELASGLPSSDDDQGVNPYYGFIAEDLYSAGLDRVVSYGTDGELEGIQYDRLTVYHHELIRELYQRVNDIEAKVHSMEVVQ